MHQYSPNTHGVWLQMLDLIAGRFGGRMPTSSAAGMTRLPSTRLPTVMCDSGACGWPHDQQGGDERHSQNLTDGSDRLPASLSRDGIATVATTMWSPYRGPATVALLPKGPCRRLERICAPPFVGMSGRNLNQQSIRSR
jgi:hypothetical protein